MAKIEVLVNLEKNRLAWVIEIEHGTVLETCAIDALMRVCQKHGDYWTYYTYDKLAWVDFKLYEKARSKAIAKEMMDRYA